jgi:hypothetical protein
VKIGEVLGCGLVWRRGTKQTEALLPAIGIELRINAENISLE